MNLNLSVEIGKDLDFKELVDNYDAVFLGIGATKKNSANIENENSKNLHSAMDFLKDIQKSLLDKKYSKKIDVSNKKVIVIGGGDTAMDCVRTSIRQGASIVTCAYRRDDKNMPGSKKEFINANEEGAEFSFNSSPKKILLDENGLVCGVEFTKTAMSEKDENGRASIKEVAGSEFVLEADIVIMALGFSLENPSFLAENSIETDKRGRVIVNSLFQSTNSKVYAGGDCHRGANLVVTAAYEGREAAISISKKLLR
jgi:glutamate synthase (NADPH/NADH) small chain